MKTVYTPLSINNVVIKSFDTTIDTVFVFCTSLLGTKLKFYHEYSLNKTYIYSGTMRVTMSNNENNK